MAPRVLVSIVVLGLLAPPVSAVFAQGMMMGPYPPASTLPSGSSLRTRTE